VTSQLGRFLRAAAIILSTLPVAQTQIFTIVATFRGGQAGEPDPGMPRLARDKFGNFYGASPWGGGSRRYYGTSCGAVHNVGPTGKDRDQVGPSRARDYSVHLNPQNGYIAEGLVIIRCR
jgi:hypothetical protein